MEELINLLNAGFMRLRKNKIFWLLTLFSIGLAFLMIFTKYSNMKKFGEVIEVEQLMLYYSILIGVVIAIFTSLFLGVEYSDGAIRNKISIGHKRAHIYLSNFIVTIITSIYSYFIFLFVIALVGIPFFGTITISLSFLFVLVGCVLVAILAYSSIFTFIAMIISNKTITSIVSILLAFGFMIYALVCFNILHTPQFIETASITNGDTGGFEMVKVPNPKYPSESKRKLYQTLLDINPAGQMFQIVGRTVPNLKLLPIYSFGILVLFLTIGLVLFQKKELK